MIDRLESLIQNLPDNIGAALITSNLNRRYYLNFPSSAGTILITRENRYFIIDSRYVEVARISVKNCEVILQDKLYEQLSGLLQKHGVKTLAIESESVSISEYHKIMEKLPGITILPDDRLSKLIVKQRSVKSAEELGFIAAAQDITDKTFTHILDFIKPGVSELEIGIEMEQYSRGIGSQEPAFSYIVASGANSSRPHAEPGENRVKNGDFVVLDFGATVNGYRSDMTRTVAVGDISDKQREVYDIVLKAQVESLKAIKAGVCCFDIDKIARDIIGATVYKSTFGHGLGHSLGLEIHENPRFSTECCETLLAGMVMSVEPGIYLPGEFGVRIEDIVAAEENGCRNFTASPKELIVL